MKTLILRNYFMPKYNNNVEIMHLIKLKVKKCKGRQNQLRNIFSTFNRVYDIQ